jgi:hypothetical protein
VTDRASALAALDRYAANLRSVESVLVDAAYTVGVVRNGRAELVPITIGRDLGATVEVVAGLQPTDQVIVNPSDSLASGSQVHVTTPQTGGTK